MSRMDREILSKFEIQKFLGKGEPWLGCKFKERKGAAFWRERNFPTPGKDHEG